MTDNRVDMQNHQDRENDAGNIMGLFESGNAFGTFNRRGYKENVKYIDLPIHHHDPGRQYHARH